MSIIFVIKMASTHPQLEQHTDTLSCGRQLMVRNQLRTYVEGIKDPHWTCICGYVMRSITAKCVNGRGDICCVTCAKMDDANIYTRWECEECNDLVMFMDAGMIMRHWAILCPACEYE